MIHRWRALVGVLAPALSLGFCVSSVSAVVDADRVRSDAAPSSSRASTRNAASLPRPRSDAAPVARYVGDGAVLGTEQTAATRLVFEFDPSAGAPPPDLGATPILLTRAEDAWVAPRPGRVARFTLDTLPDDAPLANSAVVEVLASLGARLRARAGSGPVYFIPRSESVAWAWAGPLSLPTLVGVSDPAGYDLDGGVIAFEVIGPVADAQIDRGVFTVSSIDVVYAAGFEHPDLPDAGRFASLPITLSRTPTGWIQPRVGMPTTTRPLGELGAGGSAEAERFHESALAVVAEAVRASLADQPGLLGHLVRPSAGDISTPWPPGRADARDIRPQGQTSLTFEVYRAVVTQVRTIAGGERWERRLERQPDESLINRPEHADLIERSLIPPPESGGVAPLANRTLIDRATARFNRHPGRRVDAALAPAGENGALSLDYLVTENRPWQIYAEAANTGTETTGDIRFRAGFSTTQLTDRDDTLRVEYLGAESGSTHAIVTAYETPLIHDRLRLRVFGGYNEYTARDVGLFDLGFEGEGWDAGAELILNVLQRGRLFVDATAGVRVERRSTEDTTFDTAAGETFLFGTLGLRAERLGPTSSLFAAITTDVGFPNATGLSVDELTGLGRTDPSRDQSALRWDASYSFFLEPLFDREGFAGRRTPDEQSLAHLLTLRVRGQHAFNNRLTPTHQQVVGGFYTVRGYEESLVASDDAVILTLEYAFHLARSLPAAPTATGELFGRDFRYQRARPFGQADWDLILRAFVDAGFTRDARALSFEQDQELLGVGIGAEVTLRRNLSARADLGVALSDAAGGGDSVDAGDARLHFAILLSY